MALFCLMCTGDRVLGLILLRGPIFVSLGSVIGSG
jgi:hypothetical protein